MIQRKTEMRGVSRSNAPCALCPSDLRRCAASVSARLREAARQGDYCRPRLAKGPQCHSVLIRAVGCPFISSDEISRSLLYVAMSLAMSRLGIVVPRANHTPAGCAA